MTVLVGTERGTGMKMATVLPAKGSSGKFAADKVLEFLAECGHQAGDIIIKTDQENAINFLVKDIVLERGDERGCRTIVEESPVASSGSNGGVERAVQTVEGQIRSLKLALEGRIGREINAEAAVVTFIAEYAAYLCNRLEVGQDGKTPYERTKGKSPTVLGIEFGEKLLWRKRGGAKLDKINTKWEYGIFVGIRQKSGEIWVADQNGVHKARSVRRLARQDRWTADSVLWVRNVPWNRYKGQEDADGEVPYVDVEPEIKEPEAPHSAQLPQSEREVPPVVVKFRQPPPRAFQIRKEDADKHGYTRGCAGCSSWFRGLGRQPHTAACRDRFAEVLKNEARFKNALIRKEEFEEKIEKKRARKEKKKEDGNKDEEMHEPKGVKEAEPENLVITESAKKGIETEKGLELDIKMNEGPAASSGLTAEQRQEGRESQENAQEVDEWEDFAGQLKKRARVRESEMEVGKVGGQRRRAVLGRNHWQGHGGPHDRGHQGQDDRRGRGRVGRVG